MVSKVFIIMFIFGIFLMGCTTPPVEPDQVCSKDLKSCPDGSTVSRVLPSCEFAACPNNERPEPEFLNALPEECKSLIFSGDPNSKIDFLVIPDLSPGSYTVDDLKSGYFETVVNQLFLGYENPNPKDENDRFQAGPFDFPPFKQNKEKFNVWYLDDLPANMCLSSKPSAPSELGNGGEFARLANICSVNNIALYDTIIIINKIGVPELQSIGGQADDTTETKVGMLKINGGHINPPQGVLLHELTHTIGHLPDTYCAPRKVCNEAPAGDDAEVFDTFSCTKWCESFNENSECARKNKAAIEQFQKNPSACLVNVPGYEEFYSETCWGELGFESYCDMGLNCEPGTGCFGGVVGCMDWTAPIPIAGSRCSQAEGLQLDLNLSKYDLESSWFGPVGAAYSQEAIDSLVNVPLRPIIAGGSFTFVFGKSYSYVIDENVEERAKYLWSIQGEAPNRITLSPDGVLSGELLENKDAQYILPIVGVLKDPSQPSCTLEKKIEINSFAN